MICIDCNTAIAAFQQQPPANIAMHRERVRHFIRANYDGRLLFPTIALSEYLWKADQEELMTAIRGVIGETMFAPAFDEVTAGIAANLGRRYAAARSLGDVAKETAHDRVALKLDFVDRCRRASTLCEDSGDSRPRL